MKTTIFVILAAIVIFGFLWIGNRRTDALMSVGECVEQKALADRFMGTQEQAWNTYADSCVKN